MVYKASPKRSAAAVLLATACATAGGAAPSEIATDVAAIQAARQRSNQAIRDHDVAKVVAFLDDDARLTISSGRFVEGREAQERAYAEQFARFPDVVYVRTPISVEISRASPLASERGTWVGRWTAERGPIEMSGEYMAMWRKTDGRWRIRSELFVLLDCAGEGCP